MNNAKSFLKHEVLNVITQLIFLLEEVDDIDDHVNLRSRLDLLAFFTAEETFILSGERAFFKEKVDVSELFLMLQDMLAHELKAQGVKLTIEGSSLEVETDFECLKNGLKYIFRHLMKHSKHIEVGLKAAEKQVVIRSVMDSEVKWLEGDFLDFLRAQKDPAIILMEGYLRTLDHSGVEIRIEEKEIILQF